MGALLKRVLPNELSGDLLAFEAALLRACDDAKTDADLWDEQLEFIYGDEYSVAPDVVAQMPKTHKIAYLARPIRTLYLMYGGGATSRDVISTPCDVLHRVLQALGGPGGTSPQGRDGT